MEFRRLGYALIIFAFVVWCIAYYCATYEEPFLWVTRRPYKNYVMPLTVLGFFCLLVGLAFLAPQKNQQYPS